MWTRTNLDVLPEKATVVRFTSTLIDSGGGLELCTGQVATALPPKCVGPVVDGLDPTGWTQSDDGVTWGFRTVTVTWPPIDGHLTLIEDQLALQLGPIGDDHPNQLPVDCAQIASFVPRDTISSYTSNHPDRTAGARSVDNGAVVVLIVVEEHLENVRQELTTADAEPCLEPVKYSTSELSEAQERLAAGDLYRPEGPVLSSASGNALNRLMIEVPVADRQTISTIADLFDDPGMLHFTGTSEILDGS